MPITPEAAKMDLEHIIGQFKVIEPESRQSHSATYVLMMLKEVKRNLKFPNTLKMLYLGNPKYKGFIPQTVYTAASQYVNGQMSQEEAAGIVTQAVVQYKNVLQRAGIKTQNY